MRNMIIVGAGYAGLRAAMAMRKAGYTDDITMIDRECGGLPYERPTLSKWVGGADRAPLKDIIPPEQFDALGLRRIKADVKAIDRKAKHLTLDGPSPLPYTKLLLATGARARQLSNPKGANIHYLRNDVDAAALLKGVKTASRALIIGGGFIGLELAASLRSLGLEVTVLEAASDLLTRAVSPQTAALVRTLHENKGVRFEFRAAISQIETHGQTTTLTMADGTTHETDMLIAGIGSIPNTTLAHEAELNLSNGIVTDQYMTTSDPDIFAAGDCCNSPVMGVQTRLESWQAAGDQGEVAGRNMIADSPSDLTASDFIPWFWSEQYDYTLQISGLKPAMYDPAQRSYAQDRQVIVGLSRDNCALFAEGIGPGTSISKDVRLAARLIGKQCALDRCELEDVTISFKKIPSKARA